MVLEDQYKQENPVTPRMLACAMRCQLCTGSFDGRLDACSCAKPSACPLGGPLWDILREHPAVQEKLRQNQELYGMHDDTE